MQTNIVDISVDLIDPSPYQHRQTFSPSKLQELANSIARDGLIQPVVLRVPNGNGRYELIAGERRWRAVQLASLPTILARLVDVTDIQARRMCAAENLQREDLSAIEAVSAIVEMVDAELIEDRDYQRLGETPVGRVKWLLGRMESCRVNNSDYGNFIHKFMDRVNIIFQSLPKPLKWSSFYNNDLPLVTSIDEDVAEFAAHNKLNKSQTKATQQLKKEAPEIFRKAKTKTNDEGKSVIDIGLFHPQEVEFSDLSSREIGRLRRHAGLTGRSIDYPETSNKIRSRHKDIIWTGDFRELGKDIPDDSIDLIFTDPPYYREFIPLYGDLAELGLRILKPGGSLICYVGHYALPEILPLMTPHLRFWWTLACMHSGNAARLQAKRVYVEWKPMLWFVKEERRITDYVSDLVKSKPVDKELHEWEQSTVEAEYYIDQLTRSGEMIVDPMCGSGTTCLAALKLGREALGIEKDASRAIVARNRIAEYQART